MKTCIKCRLAKPETEFSWKVQNVKRVNTCKSCHSAYRKEHYQKNKQKYIDKARAWEAKQGGKIQYRHSKRPEEWEENLKRFEGKCWLCKRKEASRLDHDHSCCPGQNSCVRCFRGALCPGCNTGLGLLGDNIEGLQKAIDYLQEYEDRKN